MSPSNQDNTLEEPVDLPVSEKVIATIREQLGKPYKLGTEGPDTFDCSGLIYFGFNVNNALPLIGGGRHRANWYMRWFIENENFTPNIMFAERGDIIFYGNKERATHCGIYLGRNKRRIISALVNPFGVSRTTIFLEHPAIKGVGHVVYTTG